MIGKKEKKPKTKEIKRREDVVEEAVRLKREERERACPLINKSTFSLGAVFRTWPPYFLPFATFLNIPHIPRD